MKKYIISIRSYFANELLRNLDLFNKKEGKKILFSKNNNAAIELRNRYEAARKDVLNKLHKVSSGVKVDMTLPYDARIETALQSFGVTYCRPEGWSEKDGISAAITLPKPRHEKEAWAAFAVYDFDGGKERFFLLEHAGYKKEDEPKDFNNAKFVLTEWVSDIVKQEVGKPKNMAEVLSLIDDQKNSKVNTK